MTARQISHAGCHNYDTRTVITRHLFYLYVQNKLVLSARVLNGFSQSAGLAS